MSILTKDAGAGEGAYPWQRLTRGCALRLHAPIWDIRPHLAAVQAELAALEGTADVVARSAPYKSDGGHSITLIGRAGPGAPGTPTSALAFMPTLGALLSGLGLPILGCYFSGLPPGGILPWHFEDQAPYSAEARMVVPILAPAGARTLLSHDVTAYPAGLGWVGDVNFPHQVENFTPEPRMVMLVDVKSGPALHRRIPPDMIDQVPYRLSLAQECRNLLREWRACRD